MGYVVAVRDENARKICAENLGRRPRVLPGSPVTLPLVLEAERKYDVGPVFTLPDLDAALPPGGHVAEQPASRLRDTYYDTADLRLARSGALLWHRRGGTGPPWTAQVPGRELAAKGAAGRIPEELVQLVLSLSRGAPLLATTTLLVERRAYHAVDRAGSPLAELVDDTMSLMDGRRIGSQLRQLRLTASPGIEVRDQIGHLLLAAGAVPAEATPAPVRSFGPLALQPPDLPAPRSLGPDPSAADVMIEELRQETVRLLRHDPEARLAVSPAATGSTVSIAAGTGTRAAASDVRVDHGALAALAVACRRLRTDLRVFSPLLAPAPGRQPTGVELLGPLRGLAGALRAVTAPGALRDRLATLDASCFDADALVRLDGSLAAMQTRACTALATAMTGAAYPRMLEGLVGTARAPRLREPAHAAASEVLPALAATFWERFRHAAERLTARADAEQWRSTRRAARRLRRLSQLAEPAVGTPAKRLVEALEPLVSQLDAVRDADRATQIWLAASEVRPTDRALAIGVGRLVEREHVLATSARAAFLTAWREQEWRTATEWLI